jgi:hypothetical protein
VSAIGRWIKAKFTPIRRGKSAASLSSGCMIRPTRSNFTKSSVSASATPGPLRPNAV